MNAKSQRPFALLALAAATAFSATRAQAAVTILDNNDWKVQFGGFVEADYVNDSTRSFTEVIGNTPVAKAGTIAGDNGRTMFSDRNSRFAFTVLPPVENEWKGKGYLEFDLLGFDPTTNSDPTVNATNSESSFLTNPTLRMRHGYLSFEHDGWIFLAGQTWSLLGWQTQYMLSTVSVPPAPGVIYQRTPQFLAMKTWGETQKIQAAVSLERPSQSDSQVPNLNAAVRYIMPGWSSGFTTYNSDEGNQPFSVGLSGSWRQFQVANGNGTTQPAGESKTSGIAYAADALIPIIPSSDGKDYSNTLTLVGEFSQGSGYGDEFPSWTGGLGQLPSGTNGAKGTNLDKGLGGFDAFNDFIVVQLQTWNAQLQYHMPTSWHMFATVGYGQLAAQNMSSFAGASIYDHEYFQFVNLFYDMTSRIRWGAEYSKTTTHYATDEMAHDDRYQLSAYFRF